MQTSLIFAAACYLLFNLGAILMLGWWEGAFTEEFTSLAVNAVSLLEHVAVSKG